MNNMNNGILSQINNVKPIEYKVLDKQAIFNILDKVQNTLDNKPVVRNMYVGGLTYIAINIIGLKDSTSIQIGKLFQRYNLYNRLIRLSNLKAHHITVGYSKMSTEDYTQHRKELINNKDIIENKIYELWNKK